MEKEEEEDLWMRGIIPLSEEEYKELMEKAKLVDFLEDEIDRRQGDTRLALKLQERLEAIKTILSDFCDHYGTETCQEGVCDVDPDGWEGCLARQILEILEEM